MSAPDVAYLLLRFALASFAGAMAVAILQYGLQARRDGRRWKVGIAGGILLIVVAAFSIFDAIYHVVLTDDPTPISNWLWLFGFDFLLPIWSLQLLRAWRQRDNAEAALARLAATDGLTNVLNRRGFFDHAARVIAAARRDGESTAIVLFDVDRFKMINDGYGHDAGDMVLRSVAAAATAGLRVGSVFGRVGGEEFAVVLPGVNLEQAASVAERIRADIRSAVAHPGGATQAVTVSAGVAAVAETGDPKAALTSSLVAADAGLYEAKRNGRDRVVLKQTFAAPSIVPAIAN